MKKQYILLMFLFFCSTILLAQVEKGKWLLAGYSSLMVDIGKEKWESNDGGPASEYKYTHFNFTPEAGYFVIDKLAAGLFLDYEYYKDVDQDDNDSYKYSSFIIGPFAKYYIIDYKNFWPYVGAGIGFGADKSSWDGSDAHKSKLLNYRLGGGVAYFLSDNVALDLFLGYNHYVTKFETAAAAKSMNSSDTSDDINGEFKMSVGVIFTFGK